MKSKKVNNQPQEITDYPEIDPKDQNAIECINEIFMSPLTGSYNWDYIVVEDRIKKLYELGKELNWNVSSDLDWSQDYPKDKLMINYELFQTPESVLKGYDDLSDEKKVEMDRHRVSWNISQFLHGEQGALLVASQLVSCAPTFNAKMYAASQTFDEARHVEGGEKVAKDFNVNFLQQDVTNTDDWERVINEIKNKEGKLNVLVNNAGIGYMGDVEATTNEAWDMVHKVDLDSVFYGCKYALPLMRDSGNGSIINISSISGIVAGHNFTAYNSAKAAVRHLSKSVALHCARTTNLVRCNSVHPVFARTEILEALLSDTSNDMLSKLERQIPVRKLAEVDDIANAILFLASDESKMITGTEIVIDGGLSAQ